jgi:type I restriction enzyme M protein
MDTSLTAVDVDEFVVPGTRLPEAIRDGHARIERSGSLARITYVAVGQTERMSDPEEAVRAEFWATLIYDYEYEPSRIGVEALVPDRTPVDRADLVIFRDDERTRPYAVIECKRDGISDAEFDQAVEQAVGNGTWAKFRADYVMVVAGATRRTLDFTNYGILEREANILADLPRAYGRPQEFKYHKGGPIDIRRVRLDELITALRKCHQSLWGGGRLSPPTAFGELCKLIFVKIYDEKANRRPGEPYEFQIKTYEPAHRLAERIHDLYEQQKSRDPEVFTDRIRIDDGTLRTIVSHLEGINLNATDPNVKGVAFERFMDGFFKGDFGQYFTPRPIIRFAVQMIGVTSDDLVLDPACGSAGFLLEALEEVRQHAEAFHEVGTPGHRDHWRDFARANLYGIEINDEIARVAKMNMMLHEDGHTNVIGADALERLERLQDSHPGFAPDRFSVVLTNPPFGAQVTLTERPYLRDYELGSQGAPGKTRPRKSQKTEILFIERIAQFLRPGSGRAAIVLPDGLLTNASLQYVRDFIVSKFQILAVVSLPQTAFAHFGTAVKASLVFVRRRADDEEVSGDEAVFMAAPEFVGYDATGRETKNQLDDVLASYRAFVEDPSAFFD